MTQYGEGHYAAKLTAVKVREMRRLHEEDGVSTKALAKMHGVNYTAASKAVHRITWRRVE